MNIEIIKEKPDFSLKNHDKRIVSVQFFYPKLDKKTYILETSPNMSGKIFKWLPTYEQLNQIKKALEEIEKESWNNNNN